MRSEPTPVLAWRRGSTAHDHYEQTRPFSAGSPEPVLLVGLRQDAGAVLDKFATAETLSSKEIAAGSGKPRTIRFFRLTGFKGGG